MSIYALHGEHIWWSYRGGATVVEAIYICSPGAQMNFMHVLCLHLEKRLRKAVEHCLRRYFLGMAEFR